MNAHLKTSELVQQLLEDAHRDSEDGIPLGRVMDAFSRRAFGGLVFFITLPAFIPAPFGVIIGPLLGLIGLQMILGFEHPWLPKRVRAWRIPRDRLERLSMRMGNGLRRLERFARPRLEWCGEGPGQALSGLSVIILGTLLALPIPLTNWPFGIALCTMTLGLIERDGVLIVAGWLAAAVSVGLVVAGLHGLISWNGIG
jgi:hypothetical protein